MYLKQVAGFIGFWGGSVPGVLPEQETANTLPEKFLTLQKSCIWPEGSRTVLAKETW